MNNNYNDNVPSQREVDQMQEHQQKLLQQNLDFIGKVARIETQQEATKEHLERIERQMSGLHDSLTDEIRTSVGARIQDIVDLQMQQQDVQNKIVNIQGRQGEQIDEIRKTLDEFTKIQTVVTTHEARLNAIEQKIAKLDDVDKVRTQGKWALFTALTTGVIGLVGTILAFILG